MQQWGDVMWPDVKQLLLPPGFLIAAHILSCFIPFRPQQYASDYTF